MSSYDDSELSCDPGGDCLPPAVGATRVGDAIGGVIVCSREDEECSSAPCRSNEVLGSPTPWLGGASASCSSVCTVMRQAAGISTPAGLGLAALPPVPTAGSEVAGAADYSSPRLCKDYTVGLASCATRTSTDPGLEAPLARPRLALRNVLGIDRTTTREEGARINRLLAPGWPLLAKSQQSPVPHRAMRRSCYAGQRLSSSSAGEQKEARQGLKTRGQRGGRAVSRPIVAAASGWAPRSDGAPCLGARRRPGARVGVPPWDRPVAARAPREGGRAPRSASAPPLAEGASALRGDLAAGRGLLGRGPGAAQGERTCRPKISYRRRHPEPLPVPRPCEESRGRGGAPPQGLG
eukprot:scaffold5197_cov393-Prasinococcus_capsulatus_cf.AAC.5